MSGYMQVLASDRIEIRDCFGGVAAVVPFAGFGTNEEAIDLAQAIMVALGADDYSPKKDDCSPEYIAEMIDELETVAQDLSSIDHNIDCLLVRLRRMKLLDKKVITGAA